MTAFGYVRKSRMDDDSPTQSPAVQEDRIRALHAARGDADELVIVRDLNVSGGRLMDDRPGFAQIVDAINDGACSAVYAFDLSRLFRNLREQLDFFEMTTDKEIPVRLASGDVGEVSGATGKLMLSVLGAMNQWMRENTSEKIKESLKRRERETGKRNGGRPYGTRDGEDAQAVLDAYRATESLQRAARLLNEQGVPTRNGASKGWSPSAVNAVVARLEPTLLKDPANTGHARSKGGERKFRFSRLLGCSVCGSMLTGSLDRGMTRYSCHAAGVLPHGRSQITESILTDAIAAETDRALPVIKRRLKGSRDDEAKLEALAAKRARYTELYGEGAIDRAAYDAKIAEITEGEKGLVAMTWMRRVTVAPDVRDDDATKVNAYLRRLFDSITVDMATPGKRGVAVPVAVEAVWRDPSMRV